MNIQNRVKNYPNRVIIEVDDVQYDVAGNISKLYGTVVRNEGDGVDGTCLNAKNLTLITKGYYVESPNVSVSQNSGETTDSFEIEYLDPVDVTISNSYTNIFSVNYIDNPNTEKISINVTAKTTSTSGTGAEEYNFTVTLKSKETGVVIGVITCTVYYQFSSTNPTD